MIKGGKLTLKNFLPALLVFPMLVAERMRRKRIYTTRLEEIGTSRELFDPL
jgi:hypothetical protein